MQHSRLWTASVCAAALICAVPAFALDVGHRGSAHHNISHRAYAAGGRYRVGWRGAFWHSGRGSPLYVAGYGYPYGYDYDYPGYWFNGDYGNYGYATPAYDYSYGDSYGYGYGPGAYAQGTGQNFGSYGAQAWAQLGEYCRTPVNGCPLHSPGVIGASCSCRCGGSNRIYGQVSR